MRSTASKRLVAHRSSPRDNLGLISENHPGSFGFRDFLINLNIFQFNLNRFSICFQLSDVNNGWNHGCPVANQVCSMAFYLKSKFLAVWSEGDYLHISRKCRITVWTEGMYGLIRKKLILGVWTEQKLPTIFFKLNSRPYKQGKGYSRDFKKIFSPVYFRMYF